MIVPFRMQTHWHAYIEYTEMTAITINTYRHIHTHDLWSDTFHILLLKQSDHIARIDCAMYCGRISVFGMRMIFIYKRTAAQLLVPIDHRPFIVAFIVVSFYIFNNIYETYTRTHASGVRVLSCISYI